MRRGESLLGQTISLCCTRAPRFRVTLPCQTDPGSLMRLAGTPILVLLPVVPTWRRGTAVPEDVTKMEARRIPRNKSGRRSAVDWSWRNNATSGLKRTGAWGLTERCLREQRDHYWLRLVLLLYDWCCFFVIGAASS